MSATRSIAALDLGIVAVCFVVAARTKTGEDLFLAGRSLT